MDSESRSQLQPRISQLRKELESSGFDILGQQLTGRSGVRHSFAVVAKRKDGLRAFELFEKVTEQDVVGCFAKGVDTGVRVRMVYTEGATEAAKRLAEGYGLKLMTWQEEPWR